MKQLKYWCRGSERPSGLRMRRTRPSQLGLASTPDFFTCVIGDCADATARRWHRASHQLETPRCWRSQFLCTNQLPQPLESRSTAAAPSLQYLYAA